MEFFSVNQQTCKKDGMCAAVCPLGIIEFKNDENPKPIDEAEDVCILCGHCVAVCPTNSFSHSKIPIEQCSTIKQELAISPEQCEQFFRSRRSIRVYKKKQVPKDDISRLIETAGYAPSGHNCQCVEWMVLDDRKKLRNLSEKVVDWMCWVTDQMSDLASDLHLYRAVKIWETGRDVILRDAPVVIIAHAEKENFLAPSACTIALAYLELTAISMGLGACWAGYFNIAANNFQPLKEALAIPKEHECFGSMMLGYPKFKYSRIPTRKSPRITWL